MNSVKQEYKHVQDKHYRNIYYRGDKLHIWPTVKSFAAYFLRYTLPHYLRYTLPYQVAYIRYVLRHRQIPRLGS